VGKMNGKTIAQIADEIGVTKQAIQKRMKKEPLQTVLKLHITKKSQTIYISSDGEKLIKSAYGIKETKTGNQAEKAQTIDEPKITTVEQSDSKPTTEKTSTIKTDNQISDTAIIINEKSTPTIKKPESKPTTQKPPTTITDNQIEEKPITKNIAISKPVVKAKDSNLIDLFLDIEIEMRKFSPENIFDVPFDSDNRESELERICLYTKIVEMIRMEIAVVKREIGFFPYSNDLDKKEILRRSKEPIYNNLHDLIKNINIIINRFDASGLNEKDRELLNRFITVLKDASELKVRPVYSTKN
jgi:predicted DNA binding protein